ncbi:MAG: ATP-binding cassette domain-containing protein, partial [Cyanobacteria bacterium P01_A01_bin.116]
MASPSTQSDLASSTGAPPLKKLVLENVQKTYGKRTVVKGVSLSIAQGEIVGLLGPNGAGKTTTFYMATGLVRPDGGKVM